MQPSRHRQIMDILRDRGTCSVEDLARQCGVSDMTIRRDLQRLAEGGQLVRTHGGAAAAEQVAFEFQFLRRSKVHRAEKDRIGRAAADLVQDGQSVMLDSGSTTLAIAKHLRVKKGLTVITTSLPIASALQQAPGVEVLLLGGFIRRESPDLEGPLTESNLENLKADVAFVGADGIDLHGTVYNASLNVARMLKKMAAAAAAVWVVADSGKIGRTALSAFGNVAKWKGLITDGGAPEPALNALRGAGVHVVKVGQQDDRTSRDEAAVHA